MLTLHQPTRLVSLHHSLRHIVCISFILSILLSYHLHRLYTWVKSFETQPQPSPKDLEAQKPIMMEERSKEDN